MKKKKIIKCGKIKTNSDIKRPPMFKNIDGSYITFVRGRPVISLSDLGKFHKFYSEDEQIMTDFYSVKRWRWDRVHYRGMGGNAFSKIKYKAILNGMKIINNENEIVKELI